MCGDSSNYKDITYENDLPDRIWTGWDETGPELSRIRKTKFYKR